MSAPATNECLYCHGGLRPTDARCRACGTLRGESSPPPKPAKAETTDQAKLSRGMIDNPRAVLVAVFCAMMFLGIPLIWMCRAWSPTQKAILTVVTLLYSGLLIWGFWLIMIWVWGRLSPHF